MIETLKNRAGTETIYPVTKIEAVEGLEESLNNKQATLVSGTNIKTINGESILGSGNIEVSGGGGGESAVWGAITGTLSNQTDLKNALDAKYEKPSNGIPASDLASGVIPDTTAKADKVTDATEGNFAGLDSNGNLADSGKKASDFLTEHQDITGKEDTSNRVSSWQVTPDDTHYPTEKLVKDSLDTKQATLESGVNIKTINNESILGSGNITIQGGGGGTVGTLDTTQTTAQSTSASESLSGSVKLHKISKTGTFSDLLSIPTTISGYGITDAKIEQGVITLGSQSITPLTSHQDISGKADKVSGAISGHLAGLDGNGNLTDSGKSASDFVASTEKLVKYSSQNLSSAEQTQARTNIGAGTSSFSGAFADLSGKPTTISGYGITDAKIEQNVITLGSNTITVPDLTDYTDQELQTAIDTAFANL